MSYPTSPETGPETHQMGVKVLYSFDDNTNFLARSKSPQRVQTITVDETLLGVVGLGEALRCAMEASPELFARDYAVYAMDVFEPGLPLVGHGRVSEILRSTNPNESIMVSGRVCASISSMLMGRQGNILEVRLRFNQVAPAPPAPRTRHPATKAARTQSMPSVPETPYGLPALGRFAPVPVPGRTLDQIAELSVLATRTRSEAPAVLASRTRSEAPAVLPTRTRSEAPAVLASRTRSEAPAVLATRTRSETTEITAGKTIHGRPQKFEEEAALAVLNAGRGTAAGDETLASTGAARINEFNPKRFDRCVYDKENVKCLNCGYSESVVWYDYHSQTPVLRRYYASLGRAALPALADPCGAMMCTLCHEFAKTRGYMRSRSTIALYHRKRGMKRNAKAQARSSPKSSPKAEANMMPPLKMVKGATPISPAVLRSAVSPKDASPFINDFRFLEGQNTPTDGLPQLAAKCNTTVINLGEFDEGKENAPEKLGGFLAMGSDDAMTEFEQLIRRSLKGKSSPISTMDSPFKFDDELVQRLETDDSLWMDLIFTEPLRPATEATPVDNAKTPARVETFCTMPSSPLRLLEDETGEPRLPLNQGDEHDSDATAYEKNPSPNHRGYDSSITTSVEIPLPSTPASEITQSSIKPSSGLKDQNPTANLPTLSFS